LTHERILPEARILAIADVVEAMSSHRPYRAALGMDAALAEIADGRDTRYDAHFVDICTDLVVREGFTLIDGDDDPKLVLSNA
jgi:HD-GYP domain-containing protein (c-di-GMP phosphodiesterase class II)